MAITVKHSTAADGTFSATGAAAWDANHTLTGLGTMAEQNANNVNITGGSITGVSGLGTVTSVGLSAPSIFTVGGSPVTSSGTLALTYSGTALPVANGGTGVTTSTGSGSTVLNTSPTLTTPAITGGTISNLTQELIGQSTDQGTGVLQVTGQSTFNGAVTDKSLNLQGGNNLVIYSQLFSNAAWLKQNTTVVDNSTTAPDGSNTASLIYPSSSGTYREIYISFSLINVQKTYSTYLKAQNKTWGFISTSDNGNSVAYFNLSTGVVGTVNSGITSASITLVRNGWYRCSIVATVPSGFINVGVCDADASTSVIANSTDGIYIWGAQVELGSVASNYTPTTTTAVTTTNNISVPSGQVITQTGTTSLPAIAIGQTNKGFISNGANGYVSYIDAQASNSITFGSGVSVRQNGFFAFSNSSDSYSGTWDTFLYRDSANTLAQRNSTNAQTFRLYNTYTDASNYERHSHTWSSNVLYAKNENAGTGSARLYVPVTGATTVASLPSASTAGIGARSFVTDALAPSFGVAVTGGGAVKIPVYSDGTSWYVG